MTNQQADALHYVLGERFWCCTRTVEFPHLIRASRDYPLIDLLDEIALDAVFDSWTIFDRFCALVVCLSAAIPFFNARISSRASQESRRIQIQRLIDFCSSFEQLLDPGDGVNASSNLPVFAPSDNDADLPPAFPSDDEEGSDVDGSSIRPIFTNFSAFNAQLDGEDAAESIRGAISEEDVFMAPSSPSRSRKRSKARSRSRQAVGESDIDSVSLIAPALRPS